MNLLLVPDYRLFVVSSKITSFDNQKNRELFKFVEELSELVYENKGVGIAFPQVGVNTRGFLIKENFYPDDKAYKLFLNPSIVEASKETSLAMEGCLSIPTRTFGTLRHDKVTYEAHNIYGCKITGTLEGMCARIFQHELDHLNGITIMERALFAQGLGKERDEL